MFLAVHQLHVTASQSEVALPSFTHCAGIANYCMHVSYREGNMLLMSMILLLKQPNCCTSILFTTSSIIHRTTKSPKTLDRQGVRKIGRVSPSQVGCDTFGIGEINAQCGGKCSRGQRCVKNGCNGFRKLVSKFL